MLARLQLNAPPLKCCEQGPSSLVCFHFCCIKVLKSVFNMAPVNQLLNQCHVGTSKKRPCYTEGLKLKLIVHLKNGDG